MNSSKDIKEYHLSHIPDKCVVNLIGYDEDSDRWYFLESVTMEEYKNWLKLRGEVVK